MAAVTDRQERALSFGSIAENYNELRPQAPQNAVDWLVPAGCGVAVDVGAGTGLFTRTLRLRQSANAEAGGLFEQICGGDDTCGGCCHRGRDLAGSGRIFRSKDATQIRDQ